MKSKINICFCFLVFLHMQSLAQNKVRTKNSSQLFIIVNMDNKQSVEDTLELKVWDHIFGWPELSPHRQIISTQDSAGVHHFTVTKVFDFIYFSLGRKGSITVPFKPYFNYYLAQPGDTIQINIGSIIKKGTNRESVSFSGASGYAYMSQRDLRLISKNVTDSLVRSRKIVTNHFKDSLDYLRYYADILPSIEWDIYHMHYVDSVQIAYLQSKRKRINSTFYNLIKLDILGQNEKTLYASYQASYVSMKNYISTQLKDSLQQLMKILYQSRNPIQKGLIQESLICKSYYYTDFLFNNAILESDFNYHATFQRIIEKYSGRLKDQLISSFLSDRYQKIPSIQSLMDRAIKIVKTDFCVAQLQALNDLSSIGKPAYIFTLPDKDGRPIRLDQFKGKVVYVDFWFVGCGPCTEYYKSDVRNAEEFYKGNQNVVFVTICTNSKKEAWQKALLQDIYTSDKAINLIAEGELSGYISEKYFVRSAPNPILIGRNGNIFNNSQQDLRDNLNGNILITSIQRAIDDKNEH